MSYLFEKGFLNHFEVKHLLTCILDVYACDFLVQAPLSGMNAVKERLKIAKLTKKGEERFYFQMI